MHGGTVLTTEPQALLVTGTAETVAELAATPGVLAVLPATRRVLRNNRAAPVIGVPDDHVFAGVELTGSGQVVGIADTGLDSGDGAADVNSGHGTHVTGSVLGDGTVARATGSATIPAGTAPGAQVYFQAVEQQVTWKSAAELAADGLQPPFDDWPPAAVGLYGLPNDLSELFQQAYDAGVRVHTNSWGSNAGGAYDDEARAVDDFLWNHPDMLILFSAGNSGKDADGDGAIDADSLGSPASAKNCLTVGASENNRPHGSLPTPGIDANWDQLGNPKRWPALHAAGHVSDEVDGMAAFSSRGPTDDGRVKPDVVAPGTNILSTLIGTPVTGDHTVRVRGVSSFTPRPAHRTAATPARRSPSSSQEGSASRPRDRRGTAAVACSATSKICCGVPTGEGRLCSTWR